MARHSTGNAIHERRTRRWMLRRIRPWLIVSLTMGLLTTIGVAWFLALRTWIHTAAIWAPVEQWRPTDAPSAPSIRQWNFAAEESAGVIACLSWTNATELIAQPTGSVVVGAKALCPVLPWIESGAGPDSPPPWTMPRRNYRCHEPLDSAMFYHELAAGWPLPALACSQTIFVTRSATASEREWSFRRPQWLARHTKSQDVPLRPVWTGLLIDMLAFGAAWYVLLFGIGTIRLVRRKVRGCCPLCGYDLRKNPNKGCPECGWLREGRPSSSSLGRG